MINPMDLSGKLILVTGASSGIGRQTAVTLSRLGARVALVARRKEKLEETMRAMEGSGHVCYPFDLSQVEEIEPFIKMLCQEQGIFQGFVHCAGDTVTRPLPLNRPEKMLDSFGAVYFAFVELARCLARRGRFSDGGSIAAISSVSAANVHGRKAKVAYSSARAALECSVRCLSVELAERAIRVNAVAAGLVETEMLETYLKSNEGSQKLQEVKQRQLLGKIPPQEVANLFAFLLGDAAPHMTGAVLTLDGGYMQG